MTIINLKMRTTFNSSFCNAIEKGKCCYKPHTSHGFCGYHYQLFSLLFNDISAIKTDSTATINYEVNFVASEGVCKIFEKDIKEKRLNPCSNIIDKKGLCKKHFLVLELIGELNEYTRENLPSPDIDIY
jgi:hypothetical protein